MHVDVPPWLCGAMLTALPKKDSSSRPKAVGEVFRRLVANRGSPNKVSLKLDFANAFNTISRRQILEQVQRYFPSVLRFAHSTHGGD